MERYIAIDNVCAWPNLTVLPDDTLAVAIYNQPTHGHWRGDVEVWVSTDDGRLWEKRGAAARGEPPGNRMDVSAGCAANGDLIVISSGWSPVLEPGTYEPDFEFHGRKILDARVCRSTDGGRTWERADTVPLPDEADSWCIPFGDIVEGRSPPLPHGCGPLAAGRGLTSGARSAASACRGGSPRSERDQTGGRFVCHSVASSKACAILQSRASVRCAPIN